MEKAQDVPNDWANLMQWAESFFGRVMGLEWLLLFAIAALVWLIGRHFERYARNHQYATSIGHIAYRLLPIFKPVLGLLLVQASWALFHLKDWPALLIPFFSKLMVAWIAIRLARVLSNGKITGMLISIIVIPIMILHIFGLWAPFSALLHEVDFSIGSAKLNLYGVLQGMLVTIVLLWVVRLILEVTDQRLARVDGLRSSTRSLIVKLAQIALYIFAFLTALQALGISLTAFSVIGGALGVGIGFGLQKIASNFISGIILLFERSVEVDDVIELPDGTTGTIRLISARYTRIETPDARDIIIPNEDFITQRVISHTHTDKRARIEIRIGVHYDDDIDEALKLLVEAAQSCERCLSDPKPVAHLIAFADSSVTLALFFWISNITEGRQEPRTQVMLAILRLFKQHHIRIPYPTREILANVVESVGDSNKT